MTLDEFMSLLNDDLRNEYKHMLFYMQAANLLVGMERLFLADKLKEHAQSEMGHVFQFAHKIRGYGFTPVNGLEAHKFPDLSKAEDIINYAIQMEEEVVHNYHQRHSQATTISESIGRKEYYYDLVLFLEEQIEHSQKDVDELKQIVRGFNQ